MALTKMEKYQLINSVDYRIVVDDMQQPVLNENGDLIVMNNDSKNFMAVPYSEDVLKMFDLRCHGNYESTPGSPKDSPEEAIVIIDPVMPNKSSSKSYCTDKEKTFDTNQLLWITKYSTKRDIEATWEMLELVASKKYQDMFNNPKMVKNQAWKNIYKELLLKGYRVAKTVIHGGVKCHQKWRNLEKRYKNYILNKGNPKCLKPKCPPPYFEKLDEILKESEKYSNTVVISDDMAEPDMLGTDSIHLTSDSNTALNVITCQYSPGDDHCYVVNSSGHDSKCIKVKPMVIKRSTLNGGDGGYNDSDDGDGHVDVGLPCSTSSSRQHRSDQQSAAMEYILQQLVHMHKDTLAMIDEHFTRMEDLMKENVAQGKRLVDIMNQVLHSRLMTDRDNEKKN
ncbi:uncharacterized protein LOC132924149 [Rhopalosiphum padi]|uniref:uncharacterized protein LOC132924149 n=1 Tax=Rhopalosiphum padi TaxID=40932 RepID=UPI00298D8836|nr:uncharacterized protein LOC132924149 [Rhopalosiphum padi]XP_060844261.1 uncharacterized protein LOC132924149 [Rhopalosiphum padi]